MSDSILTTPSHHIDLRWKTRDFDYTGHTGWGYSFDVTPDGHPILDNSAKQHSYAVATLAVAAGTMVDRGNVEHEILGKFVPARGKCACGEEVILDGGHHGLGNACECGRLYDMGGNIVNYIDEAGFNAAGGSALCDERW